MLLALAGGAALYFAQQPRTVGEMISADSPDGRCAAWAGTEHAMRVFGGDKTFFRFSVQGPDFFDLWKTPIPFDRLATNYADRALHDYAFRDTNGTVRGQIVWSDDSQRVSFRMRGIEVSAFNIVDRSHSSQPGYQPQREVEVTGSEELRDCFLDLDTGQVMSAPRDLVETLRAEHRLAGGAPQSELVRNWMQVSGADLWKRVGERGLTQLDGVQIAAAENTGRQADTRAFATMSTNRLLEAVRGVEEAWNGAEAAWRANPVLWSLNAANVHAVKTREGAVALVEILEEDPRSDRTRLRYKLAPSAPVIPQDAAIRAISDYGGFVKTNAEGRVFRISLVYDEDDQGNRRECAGTSEEIAQWFPAFPELEELWLFGSQATDQAMSFVGQLPRLKELMMWNVHVTDEGVAKLKDLEELRHIHINDARIGDASLAVLATLPRLEGMSLQGNNFTDAGLASLQEMTQLREL